MQQPAEWREKAAHYSEKARATEDFRPPRTIY